MLRRGEAAVATGSSQLRSAVLIGRLCVSAVLSAPDGFSFLPFTPGQSPVLRMAEGDTVYDYCWYPKMSSLDADTCL